MKEFTIKVDEFVANTEAKMMAVIKTAIQDVVVEMQKVGPSKNNPGGGEGGKMRVDTGFLRWSGVASLNQVPSGQGVRPRDRTDDDPAGPLPEFEITEPRFMKATLIRMKMGDIFYFGWTANYAKKREALDGFVESASQKWQSFVDAAVGSIKK